MVCPTTLFNDLGNGGIYSNISSSPKWQASYQYFCILFGHFLAKIGYKVKISYSQKGFVTSTLSIIQFLHTTTILHKSLNSLYLDTSIDIMNAQQLNVVPLVIAHPKPMLNVQTPVNVNVKQIFQ